MCVLVLMNTNLCHYVDILLCCTEYMQMNFRPLVAIAIITVMSAMLIMLIMAYRTIVLVLVQANRFQSTRRVCSYALYTSPNSAELRMREGYCRQG